MDDHVASGAFAREAQRWPQSDLTANTASVIEYMQARLAYLDEAYAALAW